MIPKDTRLVGVIPLSPETRRVFDKARLFGRGGVAGSRETVEFFARLLGIARNALLEALNDIIGRLPEVSGLRLDPKS